MRFKDVFSIIGPDMVGPSSSHTAGAVRIGRAARQLFGSQPNEAKITLYQSFADTYRGHGTDVALAAGLLDWGTQDERIPQALHHAAEQGLIIDYVRAGGGAVGVYHPNTAKLKLQSDSCTMLVTGSSIGGGNIEIVGIDHFDIRFTCLYPTLAIFHVDRMGVLADITREISKFSLNIGHMDVDRTGRSGEALTVIEADGEIEKELIDSINAIEGIRLIRVVDLT
ncbi:L-serine ammonia-lyase, iron-sulfur-dependent subunit beta [Paenibacillus sp. N3.4]|uniref:L-serine ammonia-lyase, iron-sulfur-dependent subunit beta n=1 Tax=Paenibacillus sp. N3.4 TaxID=2603222 RepID=UPI0011CB9B92|nr:L-serine ammonia-lyase, iron-sulfur-dependent subunit beta [Paenibacillus sp. N3.4]TXK71915.1 L-serine ammonia-lyase, iron-sulfur-dependent, subunit beta [Paenibacillus sp. N3.4]